MRIFRRDRFLLLPDSEKSAAGVSIEFVGAHELPESFGSLGGNGLV